MSPDARMDDGFKLPALVVVMKYNITKVLTVEGPVRFQYLTTELRPDLFPGRLTRLDNLPGKLIRIDHNGPSPIEYFAYSGFPRSYSTCQSNHNQKNIPFQLLCNLTNL
jgi:hypothetical protein